MKLYKTLIEKLAKLRKNKTYMKLFNNSEIILKSY